jgi:hypothetical protein
MSKPYPGEAGGKCVSITGVHSHYYEGVDFNTETEQADARLITAAPDMLEALEGILNSFHESVKTTAFLGEFPALKAVQSAIIKAKGQA